MWFLLWYLEPYLLDSRLPVFNFVAKIDQKHILKQLK